MKKVITSFCLVIISILCLTGCSPLAFLKGAQAVIILEENEFTNETYTAEDFDNNNFTTAFKISDFEGVNTVIHGVKQEDNQLVFIFFFDKNEQAKALYDDISFSTTFYLEQKQNNLETIVGYKNNCAFVGTPDICKKLELKD